MYYDGYEDNKVVSLKAMVDGMIRSIDQMESKLSEYSNYQNDQLYIRRDELIQNMKGCNYSCKFCNTQCQVGYHDENMKHNCDRYGHNLRVFAGGVYQTESGM